MKTTKSFSLLLVFCIITSWALLLSTCSSGGEDAVISINLGQGYLPEKAAGDVSIDQLNHVITLSGPTGSQTITMSGAGTATATVAPGLWNINVQAFFADKLYAIGSASTDVKAGKTSNVTIQMNVVWTGEDDVAPASKGGGSGGPGFIGSGITVTVTPAAPTVEAGYTLQFSASINGTASTNVTWSVSGTMVPFASNTDIDSSGLLNVDPREPIGTPLTVKATSNVDPTKSDTVTVVVTAPSASLSGPVSIVEQGHTGDNVGKVYVNTILEADISSLYGIPTGETPTYQWYSNGTAIPSPGGTGSTYTVVSGDVGGYLTVEVSCSIGFETGISSAAVANVTGIYNLAQLADIEVSFTTDYILLVDLDFNDLTVDWVPLCTSSAPFQGMLDGNGKKINLGTNQVGIKGDGFNSYAGLFGSIGDGGPGTVKNLRLEGSMILSGAAGTTFYIGAVAGSNYGNIKNVVSSVNIIANGDSVMAGGIAGINVTNSIENCYSTGAVTANGTNYSEAGGIVGENATTANVSYCWANGDITSSGINSYAGGIAGTTRVEGDVSGCVALNNQIINISAPIGRVIGYIDPTPQGTYSGGTADNNFANNMMTDGIYTLPSGSVFDESGADVVLATQANDRNWWIIPSPAGPGWDVRNEKGMTDESNPWYMGPGDSRPRLWFE